MKYLAVLGRQPEISIAELEALGVTVRRINGSLARVSTGPAVASSPTSRPRSAGVPQATSPVETRQLDIDRLGGTLKLAIELEVKPLEYLMGLPEGKITLGVSDYAAKGSRKTAEQEALKLKKILVRHGRSVRVVPNNEAALSTATSLHNGLSGKNPRKVELIRTDEGWFRTIGVQDIDAYSRRDQARPARDAFVGMLPPKLAQILINLCGPLKPGSTVLDPFCGTGVVLQEALLMGYRAYGTDISERMVEYSRCNLVWILNSSSSGPEVLAPVFTGLGFLRSRQQPARVPSKELFRIQTADARFFHWEKPVTAVACEGYLGKPFSKMPTEMERKEQKQKCAAIILGFLKNLAGQIKVGTPVTIAAPAWLMENGRYDRMEILDLVSDLGYNVDIKTREGLLYRREGQIVARDILILRKK
ncbi:hypothetical protein IKE99_01615 [Candidatus Saccharibacteria bacterium]|nr:hypothetical protein [Candidatus Saccharibacteria bacterium]